MIGVSRNPVKARQARKVSFNSMLELPDFAPLRVTQTSRAAAAAALSSLDHVLVVAAKASRGRELRQLPQGRQLAVLHARALRRGDDTVSTRASNARATAMTIAAYAPGSTFAVLSWARRVLAECLREKPRSLGVIFAGLTPDDARAAALALAAAAAAAAFDLPAFKTAEPSRPRLRSLRFLGLQPRVAFETTLAEALGNNVARWLTALPPNVLTAAAYRAAIEEIAAARSLRHRFIGVKDLETLGAGAFLAVAQGNPERDAGIMHVSYRPKRPAQRSVALVGKGILFDTGGTNLKPFKGMLDMHTDMQGSAVALGSLLALAELDAPFAVDAWLAITENRIGPTAYKSQDIVYAANGTSIQVIHTDAEGRMVLADTLALAARELPAIIIDYATLTGACVAALTERYSGVFSNRAAANQLLVEAGVASGERVWPFPMDDDYDELLKSDVADVKQCSVETPGDHILAARFLKRFVPDEIPWIHVDLSAGQHKGGLAHIPSEITGFGVRLTIELLLGRARGLAQLVERVPA
jgi:leucyl aminopeptidase